MLWTGRILSGLVVAFMSMDAIMKFVKPKQVIEDSAKVGISGETLTVLGAVLLVSTILYAVRRTSILGAILITAYLGGAVAANVCFHMPAFNICFAILFGIITWGGLYFRDERIRQQIPIRE